MDRMIQAAKVEWITIPAPDLVRAEEFYRSIFNWEITEYSPDFLVFKTGTLTGGLDSSRHAVEGGISFSITVEDILHTLTRVTELGGRIVQDKQEIGNSFGYFASFYDPNGNLVELWSAH